MTDRGTRVRWTTAALVAPAAAALFTGTTVWASAHQPATASTTTTAAAKVPEKTVDPVVESLRTAVDANTEQVLALRDTVAALQKQAAAIAKGAKVPVVTASSSRSGSSTHRTTTRSSSSGSHTSTPAKSTPKAPVATSGGS